MNLDNQTSRVDSRMRSPLDERSSFQKMKDTMIESVGEDMTNLHIPKKKARKVVREDMAADGAARLRSFWESHDLDGKAYALAAPQIGIDAAMFYINHPAVARDTIITNPNIEVNPKTSKRIVFPQEMCLSYPGVCIPTNRWNTVTLFSEEYPDGWEISGIGAVVMQHEMGHIDGVPFQEYEFKKINIGRNDPCICGSGKKYKKCCGG